MTTEEKIKKFMEITVTDVTEQKKATLSEYQKSLDHIFEEHKEASLRQAQIQVQNETQRLQRDVNIELSRQQLHIKRKIARKQTALKEQLFEEVKQKLQAFMKSDEYTSLLVRQIESAKQYAGNQYMIIYIDPNDADKAEYLKQQTGINPQISGYSFLGGIRTVIPYRNILIDDSFEKKLMTQKENFVFGGDFDE